MGKGWFVVVLRSTGRIGRGVVGKQGRGCLDLLAPNNCAKSFFREVCGLRGLVWVVIVGVLRGVV